MGKVKVAFQPDGKIIAVKPGMTILEAAEMAKIYIDAPCGAQGKCGKCKVQISKGLEVSALAEANIIPSEELMEGWRLACRTKVLSDMVIYVPETSRLHRQKILTSGESIKDKVILDPNVRKIYLELPKRDLGHQISDCELVRGFLEKEVGPITIDIEILQKLPHLLREADGKVTAVLCGNELIKIEKGDTRRESYGLAFDIGTTTVVGTLLDLNRGEELGVASDMNAQVLFGDDVVSRIHFSFSSENGLGKLQERVIRTVNRIINALLRDSKVSFENIYEMTIVGNTTMEHLFLGIPPKYLALLPFVPAFKGPISMEAKRLKLDIYEKARVYLLPNIGGWVGADSVGVILATSLFDSAEVKLAVDIGTNGEIMLGSKERLIVSSTAAGPAFEGALIEHGMRGASGAIDHVWINDDRVKISVIDGGQPRGICGSGLVDIVAELLKVGIIDGTGRIKNKEKIVDRVGPNLLRNHLEGDSGNGFILSAEGTIHITQRDVRQLQLAKGAIYAGIRILMEELKVKEEDIAEVYLAGAFGNYISKESALAIGLLPQFPLDKIKPVGNAASTGAKMTLLSKKARDKALAIAKKAEYIVLSERTDFQRVFMDSMYFPLSNKNERRSLI